MSDKQFKNDEVTPEEQESKQILRRVHQESETVIRSSTQRVADDVSKHFQAKDVDSNEWAEVWGTRIGRGLGAIAFVILVIYLLQTYVLKS